jgi:putative ABC transport system permease protein
VSAVPRRTSHPSGHRSRGAARRAVIRWAWRLFRRDWRQQVLVLALLTVAVGAAVAAATAAYHAAPSAAGRFGTAEELILFDGSDPQALAADLAAAEEWFGTIEVIGHRQVPVPGSVQPVEFRSQDPRGVTGAPMLALRDGRYPAERREVAVTDGVAALFQLELGDRLHLDGAGWTVVGLVENPSDLHDEFVMVPQAHAAPPESATVLLDADRERISSFPPTRSPTTSDRRWDAGARAGATTLVLVATTVAMVLVALVAAASFIVLAQRRLRQLGMLAAIGASERHVRLVMLANGAVVGGIAAMLGTALGLAGWVAAEPALEPAFGHRVDRWDIPWLVIGACLLLAVATATVAARWPARTAARVPVVRALSGRPPRPKPARRSAALAVGFILAGVTGLALADRNFPGADQDPTLVWTLLLIAGTVSTAIAILFSSPFVVRALAAAGARAPIAARLALRDLGRHQARAAAALAAISLGLAIPVAVIIGTAAAEHGAEEGNLSDRQLLVRAVGNPGSPFVPELAPSERERLDAAVSRLAARLDDPTVTVLEMAVEPDSEPIPTPDGGGRVREAVLLGFPIEDGHRDVLAYVATPALLAHYRLDPGEVELDADVLTVRTDELRFVGTQKRTEPELATNVAPLDVPGYSSAPTTLITESAVQRYGWHTAPAGWFIESSRPLTVEQLAAAREEAAGAGLTIEARDGQAGLPVARTVATAAAALLALGVLAMTVGLIRGEATRDLRTLAATGAASRVRRNLTATTAGALALAGVALGTGAAYLGFTAANLSDLGALSSVPARHLAVIAVGVPVIAAVAGWLLAGRTPAMLSRAPLE